MDYEDDTRAAAHAAVRGVNRANIGDTWRLEEWPYQLRHALDGAELRLDLGLELFASPQRCSCYRGAFHVLQTSSSGFSSGA